MTPWNQAQVRNAMNGAENTGFWNVNVVESGAYEVRLRRWPAEADAAIDAELKAGSSVPGERPFRATLGRAIQPVKATIKIGDQIVSTAVAPGAKEVTFKLDLKAGKSTMTALFITADGTEYGAYYAYVTKR